MSCDEDFKKSIRDIPVDDYWELLELVMNNPEYLTDHYYSDFGRAMNKKFADIQFAKTLKEEKDA